ncbi:tRNA lysidine(34) synthetase TilS [Teichococcus oryzae]|uniref:tRNA(Ile)-lysidine synthase n=1 Tax=Teichococcus oryzae TaxID=1608942 RepID=A0A5B2TLV4_9PROT|nr:tRNA lysidine(34) synthetase TilS [Pseudoroseomonas oryzae]KAA2214918.1 tRNA lysidine(34) synthetase TilS [Pseudoroseomonas oryzae]
MAPLGPFGPVPRLAVGVSGGPHSLALALLAAEFAHAAGGDAMGLVVDHGLRAESAAEAAWTLRCLAEQGIPAERITLCLAPGAAMQERARAARLDALLRCCASLGRPWLLLGHHRADQAETVLFRALRGSGPGGLAGMAPLRASGPALILRPLLPIPPARLEALLAARGLCPLRDPSNEDFRFSRVRLRHALGDAGGEGPQVAALAAAARAFAGRRAIRGRQKAERLAAAASIMPEGWARLDAAALGQDDLAAEALAALIRLVAGAEHAAPSEAVRAMLCRGGGTLGGALWQGQVLCREPAACASAVPALPGQVWDGRWRVAGAVAPGLMLGALGPAAAALPRKLRRGLPARVLAGLPAFWRDGTLAGVPALEGGPGLLFDPARGALPA